MIPVTPLRDRVLILVDPPATESNGIAIPDSAGQRLMFATVVAVGSGRVGSHNGAITPPEVAVGDRVIFEPGAGTPVWLDGVEYRALHDRLLIARLG